MTPYTHQLEVLEILKNNAKGKIILPTGTGKTWIQALDLANRISEKNEFGIYIVIAPRIMLSYQLLSENKKIMYPRGIDARYLCVHSGGVSEDSTDIEILRFQNNIQYSESSSTTSSSEIKSFISKVKKENKPLIIFTTYNSAERIIDGLGSNKIDTIYCDEAHYLVRENFHTFLKKVKSKNIFFFTATEKHSESDEGLGMNNEKTYGNILYFMSPRQAIDEGLMLRPRMQIVTTMTKDYKFSEDLDKSFSNVVFQSFRQHEFAIGGENAKLLVVVRSSTDMLRFINSKECKNLMRSGVNVFAVSSREEVGNWINGELKGREYFLSKIKEIGLDPTQRMIVLHYDILTEGIDTVFTGVLPFKSLGKLKFIQTYGRVARLDPEDRKRIKNGKITSNDLESMYKPYGWIIIPTLLFEDIDDNQRITNLVYELRNYGFNPVDDMVVSNINGGGFGVIDGPDALNEIKKVEPKVGVLIETLQSTMEEERIASLTTEDFFAELHNN
jgi:tRNA(Leu) C34 or U34 (ribose-2'-O)-methylase TrmL